VDKVLKSCVLLDQKVNSSKKWFFMIYTLLFLVSAFVVFYWFIRDGRSLIWRIDGRPQHFNALMYYGTYLRNIGRQLFQGNLEVPLWDFALGFGSDVLVTLHYYVIGDPLALLAFFVPARHTEHLYHFLIIFRLYLAGVAFSWYSFKRKKAPWAVLVGALIYAFCGYALLAIRHPLFLNPLIYLPLLCLGVEKIYDNEKPHLFIFMTFISLISSFYFFYMLSILIFIYALIRFLFTYARPTFSLFVKDFCRIFFYFLIGTLMAGFIAFPTIYALLTSVRTSLVHEVPLLYPNAFYERFIYAFITSDELASWTTFGYAAVSLISVLYLLLFNQKKQLPLVIVLAVLTVILSVPFLGHVMHGFSYVTNRWMWAYSFLIAFIVTSTLPEVIQMNKNRLAVVAFFVTLYVLSMVAFSEMRTVANLIAGGLLIINMLLLVGGSVVQAKSYSKYIGVLLIMIVNFAMLSYFRYGQPNEGSTEHVSAFQPVSVTATELVESGTQSVGHLVRDDDFFRVEENPFGSNIVRNSVLQTRVNSHTFYWSLGNPYISQFLEEINHWTELAHRYEGLDGRAMLGALASNRYFVVGEGKEAYLPYGYSFEAIGSTVVASDGNQVHNAFFNEHYLPLGYTYRQHMTRDQYEALTFIERQQALMQAVLLEDQEVDNEMLFLFNDQRLTFGVEVGEGITFDFANQRIEVLEPGASLTLSFEGIPHSETYINFTNIRFEGDVTRPRITAHFGDVTKWVIVATPEWTWYSQRHNFALNMGYNQEPLTEMVLTFRNEGVFTFDDIEIIAQPMDLFPQMIANLREYTLENIRMTTNQIEGNIQLSEERILVLSVPYSEGWSAYVNGDRVEVMRANTMFMAIQLSEGDHHIVLTYWTPRLTEGLVITWIGTGLFLAVTIYFKKQKGKAVKAYT